ncbi:MAG TPA: acetolactate synthase [Planctomycetaceae bacterium]|mgnify:FL=1|nr:acetolactate synthase [Planctomycetaceae bacterium]
MPSSWDEDSAVGPATSRGRDWPFLRQFVIFLENRVGSLHDLLRRVERDDLRIVALSIVDSSDCAVARVIVDHYERAQELLRFSGMHFFETDVIGLLLPRVEQPHTAVLGSMMSAELNVQYVYPMLYRRGGRGSIALYATETEEVLRVVRERGLELVTEDDLIHLDEFG